MHGMPLVVGLETNRHSATRAALAVAGSSGFGCQSKISALTRFQALSCISETCFSITFFMSASTSVPFC